MEPDTEKKALLHGVEIFSHLGDEELDILAEYSEFTTARASETIFSVGDPGVGLFIIADGEIVIRKATADGEPREIARYITGECFGELELMSNSSRTADAVATRDSRLLVFPRPGISFERIIEQHAVIFTGILHEFIATVARRIRSTNKLVSENSGWVRELRKQVYGDKLTGLYNRTFVDEEVGRIIAATTKSCVVIVKPDNFKEINDSFGHEAGDAALQYIARNLQDHTPDGCFAFRFRGNETGIAMPDQPHETGVALAETLRTSMADLDLHEVTGTERFRLSVSVGVAGFARAGRGKFVGDERGELIETAHRRVFLARDAGGNRVCTTDT